MTDVAPPQRLLGPASVFLQSHDYVTRSLATSGDTTVLLAEDPYFALAVAEYVDAQDIAAVEEAGAAALVEQISPDAGPKRWDAYLILLSAAQADTPASSITGVGRDRTQQDRVGADTAATVSLSTSTSWSDDPVQPTTVPFLINTVITARSSADRTPGADPGRTASRCGPW